MPLSVFNVLDWPRPDTPTDAGVRLTITNLHHRNRYVDLFDTLFFDFRGPDGLPTQRDIGRNGTRIPLPPMSLEPGQSKDITFFHPKLRMVEGNQAWLTGSDLHGGWWKFRVSSRGEYRLGVMYSNTYEKREYPNPDFWIAETSYLYVKTSVR